MSYFLRLMVLAGVWSVFGCGIGGVQADPIPDSTAAWQAKSVLQLGGSQSSFQNWNEGGLNALSVRTGFTFQVERTAGPWMQTHEVRLKFGLLKQDTLALRKAEDLLLLNTTFSYRGSGFFKTLKPVLALSVRSQFAEGYNYKKNPYQDGRALPVAVSSFFAPATVSQSLGLTYQGVPWIVQRLGVGTQTTIVAKAPYRVLYDLRPEQATRFELGLESVTQIDREVFENVNYKANLKLFASFGASDLPDMIWENQVAMQVNTWLGVTMELVMLYDRNQSADLQLRQNFSLGLAYQLL